MNFEFMRIHRFIGKFDLSQNIITIDDDPIVHQVKNILRLEKGDEIILSDGNLNEANLRIENIAKNITGTITARFINQNEPRIHASLYCSILKRENFELVAQKATEVGVAEIIPMITARTIKQGIKIDRLGKIVLEAAEQSGRGIVPEVLQPLDFKTCVSRVKNNQFSILFDSTGISLIEAAQSLLSYSGITQMDIFIGPEGGWDESELLLARQNKFWIVSLGKLTLRAETAAIIASFLSTHLSFS